MLPADVARCDGRAWPGFGIEPECIDCLRRTDRIDHPRQVWMAPPAQVPCQMRIAEERRDA